MKLVITLLTLFISVMSYAQEWKRSDVDIKLPELNALSFSNRAGCAADANKPTKSLFILIDNLNLGKTLYRFAKNEEIESSEFTKEGIKAYRNTILKVLKDIAEKLSTKKLPMLPVDTDHYLVPSQYKDISRQCYLEENCPEMDAYLKKLWDISEKKFLNYIPKYTQLDNFNPKLHFMNESVVKKNKVGCYEVKKFSALEAHLYGGKPNHDALKALSSALLDNQEFLGDCQEDKNLTSLKVATYQWDLLVQDDKEWNRVGFDFLNSLKLYFSYVMKNPELLAKLSPKYAFIFPSVSLSESIIFASNGCRSISPPTCSMDFLSKNSMRLFAQDEFKNSMAEIELMKQVPNNIADDLLKQPIVDVNRDILDLKNYDSAQKWTENFFDNFSKVKGFFKLRLLNSSKNLYYISRTPYESFSAKMLEEVKTLEAGKGSEELKLSYYHLCSEYYVGTHEKLSFLKTDLDRLKDNGQLKSVLSFNPNYNLDEIFNVFNKLGPDVVKLCNRLEKEQFWKEGLETKRADFKRWYRQEVYQEKPIPFDDSDPSFLKTESGFVKIADHNGVASTEVSICSSGSECARVYLAELFRLKAVSNYLTALVPNSGSLTDSNMFNPYSERVACKVYDPWKKTRAGLFQFFVDLSQTAVSIVNPMPVYVSATIDAKKPVSFNSLMKNGKIVYDPKFDKTKLHATVMLNLGAIANIPCLVSVSDTKQPNFNYYAFNGVSLNACNQQSNNTATVNNATDMKSGNSSHAECVSCQINLVSTLQSITAAVPVIRPFSFFARALINLYQNMSDPENVPRHWEVNPFYVHETFRKYGEIPKKCVGPLSRGNLCLDSQCEEVAAKAVYANFQTKIQSIETDSFGQETKIKTKSCDKAITLYNDVSIGACALRLRSYTKEDFKIPATCKIEGAL